MKTNLLIAALLLTGSTAFAQNAKLELVGEGTARTGAEFMKIIVTAESLCKTSAQNARQELSGLVKQVTDILEPQIDKTVVGQLQILPSAASRDAVVIYQEDGTKRVLCDAGKAWNARTTLVFKLTHLDQLDALQDTVLGLEDENELSNIRMSAPQPGIFSETYDKLVDQALQKAVVDAERQAQILVQRTGGQSLTLSKVQPTQDSSGGVSYDRTQLGSDEEAQNQSSVSVSVARLFTFVVK